MCSCCAVVVVLVAAAVRTPSFRFVKLVASCLFCPRSVPFLSGKVDPHVRAGPRSKSRSKPRPAGQADEAIVDGRKAAGGSVVNCAHMNLVRYV
jgi:hypothetical protein